MCLSGLIVSLAPAQLAQAQTGGAAAFELSCGSCHTVGKDEGTKFGPGLFGIVGKSSGSAPDFEYSAALAGGKIKWTEQMLDRFLEAPDQAVPGTSMPFGGLAQAGTRAEIIAFLKAAGSTSPPAPK